MRFSTRTRYGTRAIIDVATQASDSPIALGEIARRQRVSRAYLEQIVSRLKAAGIVRVVRGQKGGVMLARRPEAIFLNDVVTALEGPIVVVDCVADDDSCDWASDCVTRSVWCEIRDAIGSILSKYSVADLVEQERKRQASGRPGPVVCKP